MTQIFHKNPVDDGYKQLAEYKTRLTYLQDRLEKVRQLFNMECDPDQIDALIYEEKALMISLNHLIKTSRDIKVRLEDMF
ncbi:MAG: DUF2508 domain-containing protein [Eubacterium sp.]|nr:DUF2508 domain-containing protein [Eubacterium sp.]